MTVTRPEAIYSTSGHDGAVIPTTATLSTTRMLMPTFSSNQDNSVHIPDMLSWQPRPAIDPQPTVDNTQFVSQTGQEVSVWIVGSSLIRNAFVHARSRTGGVNLGLHRIGVKIWWQGYGGMGLKDLESTIKRLMKYEKAPKYLVLHIAGNDLGKTKLGFLRNEIKATLEKVQSYLPNSSIVWSQILPRTNWRHSKSQDSMMACRIRINSAIASFVLKNGRHYIKYPDILPNSIFLKEDGVHLTDLGNDIFLNNLQGALEMFICSGSYTYPDTFGTSMSIS
ncbi:uncharacterized protein [Mytilus edulis]|uniref:uncharacterized protein n=1 Tax=Mytilus edulis TaxID=6550 RepID=UPI0039EF44E5